MVLGERVNDRTMSDARVRQWRTVWATNCLRGVFVTPAMEHGACRDRIDRVVPHRKRIHNVLWPDNQPGRWDVVEARKVAEEIGWYLESPMNVDGLVLLGRRVTDLFMKDAEFGALRLVNGIAALSLPHPSGRSRVWNDDQARDEWVPRLMEAISCT